MLFLAITYGFPMLVMVVCYSLMGRELWGSRSIGEHSERQLEAMRAKRKVVRMFIIVVAIFGVCWLPYHLFFVYAYHNNRLISADQVQNIYLAIYWLAMSNAMVNPLIYYWMNGRFRVYFQEVLCCCCLRLLRLRHRDLSQGECPCPLVATELQLTPSPSLPSDSSLQDCVRALEPRHCRDALPQHKHFGASSEPVAPTTVSETLPGTDPWIEWRPPVPAAPSGGFRERSVNVCGIIGSALAHDPVKGETQ